MVSIIDFFKSLFEVPSKIKTIYSLTALGIVCVFALALYMVVVPTPPTLVIGVVSVVVVGLLVLCGMLAKKISTTQQVPPEQTKESTLTRTHLSVDIEPWEDISYSLRQLEFNKLEREKKFCLCDGDYYVSWAESPEEIKLPFVQLKPHELVVSNLRKINTIMTMEIPACLRAGGLVGYVIICKTHMLHDVSCEYIASLQRPPRCLLLSNGIISKLKRRDDIAVTALKAKLALCIQQ